VLVRGLAVLDLGMGCGEFVGRGGDGCQSPSSGGDTAWKRRVDAARVAAIETGIGAAPTMCSHVWL
jgi:hypothetical protein